MRCSCAAGICRPARHPKPSRHIGRLDRFDAIFTNDSGNSPSGGVCVGSRYWAGRTGNFDAC